MVTSTVTVTLQIIRNNLQSVGNRSCVKGIFGIYGGGKLAATVTASGRPASAPRRHPAVVPDSSFQDYHGDALETVFYSFC